VTSSTTNFKDIPALVICDDKTWIWRLVSSSLVSVNVRPLRVDSSISMRESWERFGECRRIIINWESKKRNAGAIIEEILDIHPKFDVGDRIIVLTSNPTHEDVVYFNELGVRRIVRLRNRAPELEQSGKEIARHLGQGLPNATRLDVIWRGILRSIDLIDDATSRDQLDRIERAIETFDVAKGSSARKLDALAWLRFHTQRFDEAEQLWKESLEVNSNYFRSYSGLVKLYRRTNQDVLAGKLLHKMQELNHSNISRLTDLGDIHSKLGQDQHAEHYYGAALERDNQFSRALNGLAAVRFRAGDYEHSRELLQKSTSSVQIARELNMHGIQLVKSGRYEAALQHYTKAIYVLPQKEKGPMLFYNIGLCYSRWNKTDMAKEFLKLALIKEPNYEKAKRLLESLNHPAAKLKAATIKTQANAQTQAN